MDIQKEDLYCILCHLRFESNLIYCLHMKIVHKEENVLQISEKDKYRMKLIESTQHKNDSLEKSNLRESMMLTKDLEKSLKCNLCKKSFSKNKYLSTHVERIHEKKKPFKCDICDASFAGKHTLKKHIAVLHVEGEMKQKLKR